MTALPDWNTQVFEKLILNDYNIYTFLFRSPKSSIKVEISTFATFELLSIDGMLYLQPCPKESGYYKVLPTAQYCTEDLILHEI